MLNSLRRSALRAIAAPRVVNYAKPRSIQLQQPRIKNTRALVTPMFQMRWASSDAAEGTPETSAEASETASTSTEETAQSIATEISENSPAHETHNTQPLAFDEGQAAPVSQAAGSLYVGNLFFEVTSDDLREKFSEFGEIEDVRVISDANQRSRGFGYVEYKTGESANKARAALDRVVYAGREMVVQPSQRKGMPPRPKHRREREPTKSLYIGNMSFDLTDKDISKIFEEMPNVGEVRIAVDRRTGMPRGFAHVDFRDIESATEALHILSEKAPYGRKFYVDYANKQGADKPFGRDSPKRDYAASPAADQS